MSGYAWTIEPLGGSLRIDCNFQPYCRHCKNNGVLNYMKLFMIKFLNFDLEPGSGKMDAHAFDMELRCPACGYHMVCGVAASKKDYEEGLKIVERNEIKGDLSKEQRIVDKIRYYNAYPESIISGREEQS